MRRRTHALTESWSRGATTVLRALLVFALGLSLAAAPSGCGSSDPDSITVVVQVASLTTTASKLVVQATLNSKQAMQTQDVIGDLSHFGVRLPISTTGSLALAVNGFDSSLCRVAEGTITIAVGAPYQFSVTVTMHTLTTRECPVGPGPPSCSPATFCWASPLPQGNAYLGLWVTTASDAWAVGPAGTIAHYNGTTWSPVKSGVVSTLRAVWASTASDVWVVGDSGTILHYDGQTWQPTTSNTTQSLSSVWGDGMNLWAVGQAGTVLRYPLGTKTWGSSNSGVSTQLNGVWAQSTSAVFAVGMGGTIIKFDGSNWGPVSSGTTANLYGVGGDTAVYAVGDGGMIQKYNGSTAFTNANMSVGPTLTSVWAQSAGQYTAVGSGGTILRSSGGTWSADPSSSGTTLTLNAVRSNGTSPLWVAGDGGTLLSFAAGKWTVVAGGKNLVLRSIFGFSANDIWAVGDAGTALHYDGTNWTPNNPPGVTANLNGVWGSGPSDVWAVGDARTIQRWNGQGWVARNPKDADVTNLNAVWGPDSTEVWIAANTALIPAESHVMHITGGTDESLVVTNVPTFDAVWGTSANNVWALGSGKDPGTGIAVNVVGGKTFTGYPLMTRMRGLWGSGSQDIWAVGDGGVQLHWEGSAWTPSPSKTGQKLNGIWGQSISNIWAVGDLGTLLLYDGKGWTATESGTRNNLQSVWGVSANDMWAVGFARSILRAQK